MNRLGAVVGVGAFVVVAYVAAAATTGTRAPSPLRPLFDGFGSHPGQYNWVNPPREFAEGNQRPDSAQAGVTFGAEGSGGASASTLDGQALATIAPGALPPHLPDNSARIDLRPFDSTELGRLPAGLRAEGNAYRVEILYLPSRTAARTLARPGTIGLTAAARPETILFSADGRSWERRSGQPIPQGHGLTGELTQPGYYLAASSGKPRAMAGSGGGSIALYLMAAAVPLGLGYMLLARRSGSGGRTGRRGPPRGRRTATARGRRSAGGRNAGAGKRKSSNRRKRGRR